MTVNGADYQIDIIGKYHDVYSDGSGIAPLTFQFHDCYNTIYQMHQTISNYTSWSGCTMRNTHIPAIKALMPIAVKDAIKKVDKRTSAGLQSTDIITTQDDLFVLSEVEIFGSPTHSVAGEGVQYEFYSAGNSKVKSTDAGPVIWWNRSPCATSNNLYGAVNSDGTPYTRTSYSSLHIAPGFCF